MGGGEGEADLSSDEEEERKHDMYMPTIEGDNWGYPPHPEPILIIEPPWKRS